MRNFLVLSLLCGAAAQAHGPRRASTADTCLDGQDMNAKDVDLRRCPVLPADPGEVRLGGTREDVSLGAWELGETAEGDTYAYGTLSEPNGMAPRILSHSEGSTAVNAGNVTCWAKGYYRLRKMLKTPPAEYLKLRGAGFQDSFFQFQTDLRNGDTGFREITSYQDHLVKWVTRIEPDGTCVQPTFAKFRKYLRSELARRGL